MTLPTGLLQRSRGRASKPAHDPQMRREGPVAQRTLPRARLQRMVQQLRDVVASKVLSTDRIDLAGPNLWRTDWTSTVTASVCLDQNGLGQRNVPGRTWCLPSTRRETTAWSAPKEQRGTHQDMTGLGEIGPIGQEGQQHQRQQQ